MTVERLSPGSGLTAFPPREKWDDWREYDVKQWPRRVEKRYLLVPTICFNCEAACGLLAWIDKDQMRIRKFEGNPLHPASRGRNCAKGTIRSASCTRCAVPAPAARASGTA
jgi:anaerobic selenocysteine-containing dehydrogenase